MDQPDHCWRYVAESVRGPSHVAAGTLCQDSHAALVLGAGEEAWLVACVADGAGSSLHSDQGSQLACESIAASAADFFAERGSFDEFDDLDAVGWLAAARQRILSRAEEMECDRKELATTICVAVVGPRRAAFFQLGDGVIVVERAGVHGVVFWPQSGEYANTTNFLTRSSFEGKVEFAAANTPIDRLALMTDGLERLALQFDSRTPHVPFFAPLFQVISVDRDPAALGADLTAFLQSPMIESRSNDDKTLILAARRYKGPDLVLVDDAGHYVPLGAEIGRGGEGAVYEVAGRDDLVAKVYLKTPIDAEHAEKLAALTARWTQEIEQIAAWPRAVLHNADDNSPVGLLMPRMVGARQLHELYGTTNRRKHFPDALWRHLLLAARNIAAAFHTLHEAGIVLGDVNQGNMLVDPKMMVRLIDCDSFQLSANGKVFNCPVGTPHFTPPELQNLKLRDVERTPEHDRFGLAVLVFHMLFVGRHPFAGRFRRTGDLSIEQAIAERRFAFSHDRNETMLDPPPASLLLDDLPPALAALFESAFRGEPTERPLPIAWVRSLESLIKECKVCSYDGAHLYYRGADDCPWCRIEDGGGPAFFVNDPTGTIVSKDRLAGLEAKIASLPPVSYPALPAIQLAAPKMALLKAGAKPGPRSGVDWQVFALIATWVLCVAGIGVTPLWAAGALGSLAAGAYLVFGPQGRQRRHEALDRRYKLDLLSEKLAHFARMVTTRHDESEAAFERMSAELKQEIVRYLAKGEKLQDVIAEHAQIQKADFLRGFMIRDDYRSITGLTPSLVVMLESFGIETANDVDPMLLHGVPNIDDEVVLELTSWRRDKESKFVFAPEHGVTVQDVKKLGETAERRFKASQARRILTAAKQRELFAAAGRDQLAREVEKYERETERWRELAKQFRDWQSARRPRERQLNDNPAILIVLTVAVPVVTGLLHLIFG